MDHKTKLIKYLSPFVGIILCPTMIIFLLSTWKGPAVESDIELIEEKRL